MQERARKDDGLEKRKWLAQPESSYCQPDDPGTDSRETGFDLSEVFFQKCQNRDTQVMGMVGVVMELLVMLYLLYTLQYSVPISDPLTRF